MALLNGKTEIVVGKNIRTLIRQGKTLREAIQLAEKKACELSPNARQKRRKRDRNRKRNRTRPRRQRTG